MAASSSRDTPQPAASASRGAPPCASEACELMVGSFNVGFEQKMKTGKSALKWCQNFARVCAKIVEEGDCDLLFLSEVGAFRKGLKKAGINVGDILMKVFGKSIQHAEIDNYLAVWGFGGASQPAQVSLHGCAEW